MFLFSGLLFHGPLHLVQEECGDGRPHPAVWGLWEARLCCGGPQRHDEGKINGLGSLCTNTLKLMAAVTDRWDFFLPLHSTRSFLFLLYLFDCTQIQFSACLFIEFCSWMHSLYVCGHSLHTVYPLVLSHCRKEKGMQATKGTQNSNKASADGVLLVLMSFPFTHNNLSVLMFGNFQHLNSDQENLVGLLLYTRHSHVSHFEWKLTFITLNNQLSLLRSSWNGLHGVLLITRCWYT